jgi:hypothetical protein
VVVDVDAMVLLSSVKLASLVNEISYRRPRIHGIGQREVEVGQIRVYRAWNIVGVAEIVSWFLIESRVELCDGPDIQVKVAGDEGARHVRVMAVGG